MSELCLIAGFPNKNVYFGLPQKYSFIRFRNKVFLTTADKQLALFKLYFFRLPQKYSFAILIKRMYQLINNASVFCPVSFVCPSFSFSVFFNFNLFSELYFNQTKKIMKIVIAIKREYYA